MTTIRAPGKERGSDDAVSEDEERRQEIPGHGLRTRPLVLRQAKHIMAPIKINYSDNPIHPFPCTLLFIGVIDPGGRDARHDVSGADRAQW